MITDELGALIRGAIQSAEKDASLTLSGSDYGIELEVPRNRQHGDFSSNIALTLRRIAGGMDSRKIAGIVADRIPVTDGLIEKVEIAGPGFINFYLRPSWLQNVLLEIESAGSGFGTGNALNGQKILIEFVSANPTGPISVVNGRAAALGDVLGNLFSSQGAVTSREFYINDALNSTQLDIFARTVEYRYFEQLGLPVTSEAEPVAQPEAGEPAMDAFDQKQPLHFPRDGYRGEYVRDIAIGLAAEFGGSLAALEPAERRARFRDVTLASMVEAQRQALRAFGIEFDTWFYESSLYSSGSVDQTIESMTSRGYTYESDGALWLKSTAFGDDKDRVLVRSNGKATYIAADSAYHAGKFDRGFTRLINIWGADHHGYVARLKAGVAALGAPVEGLQIILTQMVSLVRDGEAVIGGKRQGNVVELKEDLIDDIGRDAARFYFLLNSYETPATVDVELARRQSNDNPVYYVQYAHARLCSILRKAAEAGLGRSAAESPLSLLKDPAELDVLRKLGEFPADVASAARDFAPHRLTRYAMELASLMNVFYENCRVLSGKDEVVPEDVTLSRIALVNGARIVLANLLTLLGISAPETM